MKSRLIEIASISLIVALASSSAFAQGGVAGAVGNAANSAGNAAGNAANAVGNAAGNAAKSVTGAATWNTATVSTTNPFGSIDVNAAGTTPDSVREWSQTRSASDRTELQGRCGVITNTANASRYPAQAQQFCRNYMVASNTSPGGGTTTTR